MSEIAVRTFEAPKEPFDAAADAVMGVLRRALTERGGARWVLAGGSTPRDLYRAVAARGVEALDWSRVDFFQGDERVVQPEDEDSNYRMAQVALLGPLGIAPSRVHRIRAETGAQSAAREYDAVVGRFLGVECWDLVLLGLGEDGHTASLFPPALAVHSARPWALATTSPKPPRERVSLSLGALNRSREVFFLAVGAGKAAAVSGALGGSAELPAAHVAPPGGRVTWFLDGAAAAAAPVGLATPLESLVGGQQ